MKGSVVSERFTSLLNVKPGTSHLLFIYIYILHFMRDSVFFQFSIMWNLPPQSEKWTHTAKQHFLHFIFEQQDFELKQYRSDDQALKRSNVLPN